MAGAPSAHGPRWRVRWQHPDSKVRFSHVLDDEAEGWRFKRWLDDHENRVIDTDERLRFGTWDPARLAGASTASTTLFGAYLEEYLNTRGGLTAHSRDDVRDAVHRVAPDWLQLPLSSIDRPRIEALIARMRGRYAPSTAYNALARISGVMGTAHAAGIMPTNPFKADPLAGRPEVNLKRATGFEEMPRQRKNSELRIPRQEWDKILSAAIAHGARRKKHLANEPREQVYLVLRMLMECGLRIGELLAITVGQCHFSAEDNFVVLEHSRRRDGSLGPTKTRKSREIMVPDDLAARLAALCAGRAPSEALFTAPMNGAAGWGYNEWTRCRWRPVLRLAREEFGFDPRLRIHPHALRMNHITWARNAGVSLRDIQRQTGQATEAVVAMYDLGGPDSRRALRDAANAWAPTARPST